MWLGPDEPPETPIADPDDLADFRSQLRRRMLCTAEEAIWQAKMLTGTTAWLRQVVKRTSFEVALRWAKGEPPGEPMVDDSPVVWFVLFENSSPLTRRARFDLRQIVPSKDATEDASPLEGNHMALIFDEIGRGEYLLQEAWGWPNTDDAFSLAQAIPELGSQILEHYPVNTAGLCDMNPGDRPTPGASPVYPTGEPIP